MLKKLHKNIYEIDDVSPLELIQNIFNASQQLYYPAIQGNEMLHEIKDVLQNITENIETQVKEIEKFNTLINGINDCIQPVSDLIRSLNVAESKILVDISNKNKTFQAFIKDIIDLKANNNSIIEQVKSSFYDHEAELLQIQSQISKQKLNDEKNQVLEKIPRELEKIISKAIKKMNAINDLLDTNLKVISEITNVGVQLTDDIEDVFVKITASTGDLNVIDGKFSSITSATTQANENIKNIVTISEDLMPAIQELFSSTELQVTQAEETVYISMELIEFTEKLNTKISKIEKMFKEISEKALLDGLTQIYNHRYIQDYLRDLINQTPIKEFSILFCDIDNFKHINDRYGHTLGDEVLYMVAQSIKNSLDKRSVVARYGGEEFIVVSLVPPDQVLQLAENILKEIENGVIKTSDTVLNVTASIGISFYPKDGTDKEALITNADKAMYSAKVLGKNNIQIFNKKVHNKLPEKEMLRDQIILNSAYALSSAVDFKNHYTHKHSVSVAFLSQKIAKSMKLSNDFTRKLFIAGLLHDIGKIGIPDTILNKTDKLDNDEWKVMQSHSIMGWEILKHINTFEDISEAIRHHHERYDGKGYPDKLSGENIPLMSRILAVADSFNAMTSNRSYRNALSKETATEEVRKNMGTQFDPYIAEVFINILEDIDFDNEDAEVEKMKREHNLI